MEREMMQSMTKATHSYCVLEVSKFEAKMNSFTGFRTRKALLPPPPPPPPPSSRLGGGSPYNIIELSL